MVLNKIIGCLPILILFSVMHFQVFSQTIVPMNLNFESGNVGKIPYPWKLSEKNYRDGYILRISEDARSGHGSLELNTDSMKQSAIVNGTAYQSISPLAFFGRTVKFSTWAKVKYRNVTGGAFIWIKVFREGKVVETYPVNTPPAITSDEWKYFEVTAKIPQDAIEIQFGTLLDAEGSIWLDDATFGIVGTNTPYTSLTLDKKMLKDLVSFTRLFAAFAYYYPDEVCGKTDLNLFAEYGVTKITDATDNRNLTVKLKEIFSHLGSRLEFGKSDYKPKFTLPTATYTSADTVYPRFRLYSGARSRIENELYKSVLQNITQMHRQSPAFLSQVVKVENLIGKSARFSVKIKSESTNPVSKGFAAIAVLDTAMNILKTLVAESSVKAGNGFVTYSVNFKIPSKAFSLDVDLVLEGDGKAIFDDASLTIGENEYLKNGGFEENFSGWRFDSRCERAGYEQLINSDQTASGKKSAELNVINGQYIKYPMAEDIYSIKIADGLYAYFPKTLLNNDKDNDITSGGYIQGERDYSAFGNPEARIAAAVVAIANEDNFSLVKCENYDLLFDSVVANTIFTAETAKQPEELADAIAEIGRIYPDNALRVWTMTEYDKEQKPLPMNFDYADGSIIVSRSMFEEIPVGSIVESIDGISADRYLDSAIIQYPGTNDQLKIMKAITKLKYDAPDSGATLGILLQNGGRRTFRVEKSGNYRELNIPLYAKMHETEKDVWYVDLQRVSEQEMMDFLKANVRTLKGLILDMRGYSTYSEYFFKYFKAGNFINVEWAIPFFSHYRTTGTEVPEAFNVMTQKITGNGNLKNVKIVAVCDETTIGINESNLELLRRNEMAVSVGTETSGAPTDISILSLPCGLLMSFSGSTAMDLRGNMMANKPFIPDYIVDDTRKSIINEKDARIEQAAEIIHDLLK